MQKLIQLKNKKGFTLIEMLIVILIIVILLAIAVPSVLSYRRDSEETADLGAAKTLYTAIEAVLTDVEYIKDEGFMDPGAAGTNWLITNQVMDPAGGYSDPLQGAILAKIGHTEFPGKYKFGYNIVTNSIDWVSYHDSDHSAPGGRTAHASKVMVYDVVNDVSGYADELGTINGINYNAAPYLHTW